MYITFIMAFQYLKSYRIYSTLFTKCIAPLNKDVMNMPLIYLLNRTKSKTYT